MWISILINSLFRIIPAVSTLLFTIICIKSFSDNQYFLYSTVMSICLVFSAFFSSLVGQPALRFGSEFSAKSVRLTKDIFPVIFGIFSGFACVLCVYLLNFKNYEFSLYFFIIIFLTLLIKSEVSKFYINGMGYFLRINIIDIIRSFGALLAIIIFIILDLKSAIWAFMALSIGYLGSVFSIYFFKLDKFPSFGQQGLDMSVLRYGISVSVWLAVANSFAAVERALIYYVLPRSPLANGYVAVADITNSLMTTFGAVVLMVATPRLLGYYKFGEIKFFYKTSLDSSLIIMMFGVVYFFILYYLSFLLAIDFFEYLGRNIEIFVMLVASSAIWQVAIFSHKYTEYSGAAHKMVQVVLGCLVMFPVLAIVMSEWIGLAGIPMAKLISGIIYVFVTGRWVWRAQLHLTRHSSPIE